MILLLLVVCSGALSFDLEALHDHMTESELAYYFQTSEISQVPEYQVVYLPEALEDAENLNYNFDAFNRPIELKLQKNSLTSPTFKTYVTENSSQYIFPDAPKDCHFMQKDSKIVAALSICNPNSVQGLILLEDSTLEIQPLTSRLQALVTEPLVSSSTPHLVKRANFEHTYEAYEDVLQIPPTVSPRASHRPAHPLTLELAVFFDEAAYKIFAPFLGYDDGKLQDLLLAYINGVQALYHHPSLGTSIELVLVRLEIMKSQRMPHFDGERGKLLDSFCAYQSELNSGSDKNPDHWDMAVYVSGLDFFAYENGRKSSATMGLAPVGGVCFDEYNCVIAEMGTTNVFGKPYPSAGFTSVYILAHEIGHNLGMHHDSLGNSCPKEGFVMSPSRGTNGETQWSTCSAEIVANLGWAKCLDDPAKPSKALDHSTRFVDNPGQVYTAKRQCEILLRDKQAVVAPNQALDSICYNLHCKTPNRSGFYFAGPALDGTECAKGKLCYGGECVRKQVPRPAKVVKGGWGAWKETSCTSGCIEKSRGFSLKKRECNNPVPVNTDEGCEGASVQYGICKDEKICKSKRKSVIDYASERCKEFSNLLPELDPSGGGLQAPHEEGRVWMGCAIFCRNANSGGFYTPRIELNDLGISPYFPDGTWCHREKNINYYCLNHHCLPENFHFTKYEFFDKISDDFPFSQNARPRADIPPEVKSYFSLNSNGTPLKTKLKPFDNPKEEDWESHDYIIIPGLKAE